MKKQTKLIVICAPSGSGKTSVYKKLLEFFPILSFAISAATRASRGNEKDGVDYYFISIEDFENKIANGEFIEWEKVYEGKFYGTLKSEVDRINALGKIPLLDIDVKGAQHIKEIYGDDALVIFVKAPPEQIKERLEKRGTETPENLKIRLDRIPEELTYESKCDVVVHNVDLDVAIQEAKDAVSKYLGFDFSHL